MSKPLAKLTIGLIATVASGFYYLAAAPPTPAQVNVCGSGNYSNACTPDTAVKNGAVSTGGIGEPYTNVSPTKTTTSVPEPSVIIGLLLTGAVMVVSTKKRNQVRQ